MFINHLLFPAFFNVEIWGAQELLLQHMRPNSAYIGGELYSGRSIKMCRVLEELVGDGTGKFRY